MFQLLSMASCGQLSAGHSSLPFQAAPKAFPAGETNPKQRHKPAGVALESGLTVAGYLCFPAREL